MDAGLYASINGLAGHIDGIDDLFELISRFGPYLMVLGLLGLWFWPAVPERRRDHQWAALLSVLGAVIALGANQVIIRLWDRPRPFVVHPATLLLAPSHDPSFPSDHAAGAFALAFGIFLVARRLGLLALLFAALLAFSRVYTGEHYVSDVLAGAVIGVAGAGLAHQLRPWLEPLAQPLFALAGRVHLA